MTSNARICCASMRGALASEIDVGCWSHSIGKKVNSWFDSLCDSALLIDRISSWWSFFFVNRSGGDSAGRARSVFNAWSNCDFWHSNVATFPPFAQPDKTRHHHQSHPVTQDWFSASVRRRRTGSCVHMALLSVTVWSLLVTGSSVSADRCALKLGDYWIKFPVKNGAKLVKRPCWSGKGSEKWISLLAYLHSVPYRCAWCQERLWAFLVNKSCRICSFDHSFDKAIDKPLKKGGLITLLNVTEPNRCRHSSAIYRSGWDE